MTGALRIASIVEVIVALSPSQSVTLVAALLCAGGLAMVWFAFYSFERTKPTRERLEQAATAVVTASEAAPGVPDPAEVLKGLAALADSLAKLSAPVAALLVATIPFSLAATLVAIHVLK